MNIQIPKQIILDNKLNEKRVMVYSYFIANRTHQDEVMLTENYIVEWCGYKVDYHKNKINEQVNNIINELATKNFLKLNGKIDSTKMSIATLNLAYLNNTKDYIDINLFDLNKIKDFQKYTSDTNKMSTSIISLIYAYLKIFNLDCVDYIYKTREDISKDLNVSKRYINRALKILYSMNLIKTENATKCEYSIYKFLDDNNTVIYVGKTTSIETRLRQHFSSGHLPTECYDKTVNIYVHKFKSQMDMDIYEIFYINKYNPLYNTATKSNFMNSSLIKSINEVSWVFYSKSDNYKVLNNCLEVLV